jgi:adenylate cyclase class IV
MEVELKLTIDETGYWTLVNHFKSSVTSELDQWNIFYETPDRALRSPLRVARLRSITTNGQIQWVFTVKDSGTVADGVWFRPEIEGEITPDHAQAILDAPSTLFQHVPDVIQKTLEDCKSKPFQVIGDFRSIRRLIPYQGIVIEADESILPNGTKFYELEIESENATEVVPAMHNLLSSLGIAFENSKDGKYEHLMELPQDQRFSREFSIA